MKINNLLSYDIDYSLLDNIKDESILLKYNILPISNDILYLVIATSNISIDIKELNNLFNQPIKLIEVDHKQLEFEWKYLSFKRVLYKLALNSINDKNRSKENSYILEFLEELFKFSIENSVSDIHIEVLKESVILRFRIDGVLNQFFRFSDTLYPIISS